MNSQQEYIMKESNDILTLFESLNNHEVFTPPRLARDMLGMIPKEVWCDPDTKLLDPCVKSGVFLRESMYLLFEGLLGKGQHEGADGVMYNLNDPKQLMKHILKNMLFGIATSELTGYLSRRTLYGVMEADTDKQTALIDAFEKSKNNHEWSEDEKVNFLIRNRFNDYYDHTMFNVDEYNGYKHEGNVFYPREKVQKKVVEDGSYEIEDTYYPFIEENTEHSKIEQIRNGEMKFDVIIGNPPYQVSDGGGTGASAIPIYHHFVQLSKRLNPKYLSFIIPSRWFAGGKGLNEFRTEMLSDKHIKTLVDFQNGKDCFAGTSISGGVCYFLRDKSYKGPCEIKNVSSNGQNSAVRELDQFSIFVRNNLSVSIIEKVQAKTETYFSSLVGARNVFGLPSKTRGMKAPEKGTIKVYTSQGDFYIHPKHQGFKNLDLANSHKVIFSKVTSEHAGEPSKDGRFKVLSRLFASAPQEACTDSYLCVVGLMDENQVKNTIAYMKTKFFRFLLFQTLTSHNISSDKFSFIPVVDLDKLWHDKVLYEEFGLNLEEQKLIETSIKDME